MAILSEQTKKCTRSILISIFTIVWILVFHYESLRGYYLEPLFHKHLPKVKFLFPPAGWVMFYRVDDKFGGVEVYGVKDGVPQLIDPHQIIKTRFVGFDNIHRGILGEVLSEPLRQPFCRYLKRNLPYFENFLITAEEYPSLTESPLKREQAVIYECPGENRE